MHTRFITLLIVLVSLASPISTQAQTQQLTLKDAVLKRFSQFYQERMQQLQWVKGTSVMSYVDQNDGEPALFIRPVEGEASAVLQVSELEGLMGDDVKLGSIPRITWLDNRYFQFQRGPVVYQLDLQKQFLTKAFTFPEGAEETTFNEDRSACAFVKDQNIYVLHKDGRQDQVTTDGAPGLVYGKAVHRNEFGINSGLFWSDNGKKLAFYRMDESMVEDYPIVNTNVQPAKAEPIKYPMAGRQSHHVTLGSYDLKSKKTVYMQTGAPEDQYLCSITWSPDAQDIYIAVLNRDQNLLQLNRYDAASGALEKTLFTEEDEKYVEPEHPLWFMPNDPAKFIWMSERDGFQHMYLYDVEGKLIRPLTQGNWEVHSIYGADESGRYLYVSGTGESVFDGPVFKDERNGMQQYTYRIDVQQGVRDFVDDRKGTHYASVNHDGKYIIDHLTSSTVPWETSLWNGTKKSVTLHTAKDPLADYKVGTTEIGHLPGDANGHRLYTRLIKPSDFDPNKKYPVLVYVYGGPHAQLITDSYLNGAPLWMHWMAEQGYIVATMDNRGSSNRGIDFEQETFRNLGTQEMVDQKAFADYLGGLPYVDAKRMAIHGWSFGGFMTMNMLLTFPGTFKAGVAGGPVCDWSMYEVMYTERYMDTPEFNPEGYKQANLVDKADQLKDDLLIIHGTIDPVVLWQHSQAFVKACVDNEIQLDYFIYPGHEHNVRGKDRYHLMEKVLKYVDERIGGE